MLHPATVQPGTLELLRELQVLPELSAFALAGGTILALQLGHRVSVDLLAHQYPLIRPIMQIDALRLVGLEDVLAHWRKSATCAAIFGSS